MLRHASASFLALTAAAWLTMSCSDSRRLTLAATGSAPAGSFSPGLVTVPIGIVLGFQAQVESSMPVTAAVDDPSIATVAPTVQGSQFVIIGLAAGQTTLRVYANGEEASNLPVQVLTQEF